MPTRYAERNDDVAALTAEIVSKVRISFLIPNQMILFRLSAKSVEKSFLDLMPKE